MFILATGFLSSTSFAQENKSRYLFKEGGMVGYRLEQIRTAQPATPATNKWLRAWSERAPDGVVELGDRVVLKVADGVALADVLSGSPLRTSRQIATNVYILQAPDAPTAVIEAERLARKSAVTISHPIRRRQAVRHSGYSVAPFDPYFTYQWHLENRGIDGASLGPDLNIRSAWPVTRGQGIYVAIGDDGIEMTHIELSQQVINDLHFNFTNGSTNGSPPADGQIHGTPVAGLVAAQAENSRGGTGVAPRAQLASWVVFTVNDFLPSEEQMMDMFQYRSNVVSVQNHSWGNGDPNPLKPSALEEIGISNAVTFGRDGKGVVIVRSGGNNRQLGGNVNDDGYPSDPRVIAVGAVRYDGRVATYSNPGASLLVSAPSGDLTAGQPGLFTTDRHGPLGFNGISFTNDLADYTFNNASFSGTSAAAPQIAGVAALILSANTNLTYRDVQQILVSSSRQYDMADPDVVTNGAGFRFSHNAGFGIPDAGQAVRLAQIWPNRPPRAQIPFSIATNTPIPDDGLRVVLTGPNVPSALASIRCIPGLGVFPDFGTAVLPLKDIGQAAGVIASNLSGTGALIQRGSVLFADKIQNAANAGAAFAVVYNNTGGNTLLSMGATDFSRIPAVFIGQTDGDAAHSLLATNTGVQAQLQHSVAAFTFTVTNTLICEQVTLGVTTDHTRRGDVRVTLTSPAGTRSVLQRLNGDAMPGPTNWTYVSNLHFYEGSTGDWTVQVSDLDLGSTGSVKGLTLTIYGVPITDTDQDGLDDAWEMAWFGSLNARPQDDPDGDGYSNSREQALGTSPSDPDAPFPLQANLSFWNGQFNRLSWPAGPGFGYELLQSPVPTNGFQFMTNFAGRFPENEVFLPHTNSVQQFFELRRVRNP